MYTVKGFLVVNEVDNEVLLMFQALFYDVPQDKYLFSARVSSSEACLLVP